MIITENIHGFFLLFYRFNEDSKLMPRDFYYFLPVLMLLVSNERDTFLPLFLPLFMSLVTSISLWTSKPTRQYD